MGQSVGDYVPREQGPGQAWLAGAVCLATAAAQLLVPVLVPSPPPSPHTHTYYVLVSDRHVHVDSIMLAAAWQSMPWCSALLLVTAGR